VLRLLLDNCLSPQLKRPLGQAGQDVVHVRDLGLQRADDSVILGAARQDNRVVVTEDRDFSALLVGTGETRPSIVYLRRTNSRPANQVSQLVAHPPSVEADLNAGAIAVITDATVRVRLLPIP